MTLPSRHIEAVASPEEVERARIGFMLYALAGVGAHAWELEGWAATIFWLGFAVCGTFATAGKYFVVIMSSLRHFGEGFHAKPATP